MLIVLPRISFRSPSEAHTITGPHSSIWAGTASRKRRHRWFLCLCAVALALLSAGCTGSNIGGSSYGWSPAAASELPSDTGSQVQVGRTVAASDKVLAVTRGSVFASGQTILMGAEQLEIASVTGNNLTVVRGANGTVAQNHEGGAAIFAIAKGVVVIFVGTRQGEVKALRDDGSGAPKVVWTFPQSGGGR